MMHYSHVLSILLLVPSLVLATTSSKRGLIYIPSDHSSSDDSIWTSGSSDLTWYYNYGPSPTNGLSSKLQFVPMLFSAPSSGSDTTFLDTVSALIESGEHNITHVLAFNEPDGSVDTGGSSVPAITAANTWIREIEPLKTKYNLTLGAPAVTGAPDGFNWLQNFFTACDGKCSVDFIPVHWYGNFEGLASHIGQVRGTYKNASIWVTEWADAGVDLSTTQSVFNMSLEYFDRIDYIERYSYFGSFRSDVSNIGPNSAMLNQNGQLTDIGSWYLGGSATGNNPTSSATSTLRARSSAWALSVAGVCATLLVLY